MVNGKYYQTVCIACRSAAAAVGEILRELGGQLGGREAVNVDI